jgi:uncharacterized protein YndB with AHSA1/START domain/uncharacterized membrane protein YphA (DoxX/SURF4 family)
VRINRGKTVQVPYFLLRAVSGLLFLQAGGLKLFGWFGGMPPEMPFKFFSEIGLAGVLEFFGGSMILLGLFTRPVAFLLSGEMAVAYWQAHAPRGFWPIENQGEPAVLFCFIFLFMAAQGGGEWSLDAYIENKKKEKGMSPKTNEAENTTDREFRSTRLLNAPRELVWKAWTEPEHIAQWWGPNGFTNTFDEFDFKPGGHWRFIMHGPDGKNYPNHSVFVEIDKPNRIVFDHVVGPLFRATIVFEEEGGKTRVHWHMLFETKAVYDAVKEFAVPGNEQNLEKLEAHLEKMK